MEITHAELNQLRRFWTTAFVPEGVKPPFEYLSLETEKIKRRIPTVCIYSQRTSLKTTQCDGSSLFKYYLLLLFSLLDHMKSWKRIKEKMKALLI